MTKKSNYCWTMDPQKIIGAKSYNYLGVWLCTNGGIKTHLSHLKVKATLITRLGQLITVLESPSSVPIRRVLRATLLPVITYVHEAFRGQFTKTKDSSI